MRRRLTLEARDKRLGCILTAPTIIILFLIVIYPLSYAFYTSFHNMNIAIPWKGKVFVGFNNYIKPLCQDRTKYNSFSTDFLILF